MIPKFTNKVIKLYYQINFLFYFEIPFDRKLPSVLPCFAVAVLTVLMMLRRASSSAAPLRPWPRFQADVMKSFYFHHRYRILPWVQAAPGGLRFLTAAQPWWIWPNAALCHPDTADTDRAPAAATTAGKRRKSRVRDEESVGGKDAIKRTTGTTKHRRRIYLRR